MRINLNLSLEILVLINFVNNHINKSLDDGFKDKGVLLNISKAFDNFGMNL